MPKKASARGLEAVIQARLEQRLGSPGKWEMLVRAKDARFINGQAAKLGGKRSVKNPTAADPNKLKASFVPYGASMPAVHDWDVLDVFRLERAWDLVPRFAMAGERTHYRLDPRDLTVGILIAGGPAAGLNMVTDSLVKRLFSLATQMLGKGQKHALKIVGFRGGYVGLERGDKVLLAPSRSSLVQAKSYRTRDEIWFTDEWATDAGVRLRTLREKSAKDESEKHQRAQAHARAVAAANLDVLFVIGGNGTLAWAGEICRALRRGHGSKQVVVVGGPKTMDNDVYFTDATFGFRTAVDNAVQFIKSIHTSAESIDRLGVIELFGAGSGFVALHAGYVSGVADYVMIPELAPDEDNVLDYLGRRIKRNRHAVLVVAEGALASFRHGGAKEKEEAFNKFLGRARERFPVADVRARYLMRDTQPNSFDLDLCKYSGKLMADTALAGFTNCSVNLWQGDYVLVPFETATGRLKQVNPWSYYLQTLLDRERLALR